METSPAVDTGELWQHALAELQLQVDPQTFRTWFRDTDLVSLDRQTCVVSTPNPLVHRWLTQKCHELLGRTMELFLGHPIEVQFVVRPPQAAASSPPPLTLNPPPVNGRRRAGVSRRRHQEEITCQAVSPRFTFKTFVVGPDNRLAHAACLAAAERPGQAHNPLFIYGGVGLGKTHLLHAIGHHALAQNRSLVYTSSETFMNEFIESIARGRMQQFRAKYRQAELLLVDDIQFLAGKEQTQEEFFHTFNAVYETNGQIVLTSDRPPRAISTLARRLQSRFVWGLIADIQEPGLETRTAILQAKLAQRGDGHGSVPSEVLELIAARAPGNVRELEGALNRVLAQAELQGLPVTTDLAKKALEPTFNDSWRAIGDPQSLIKAVARATSVSKRELEGRHRDRRVVTARQIAMYLLREHTELSLTEIGSLFGGRDHSTVLHAHQKIGDTLDHDERLRGILAAVRAQVTTRD